MNLIIRLLIYGRLYHIRKLNPKFFNVLSLMKFYAFLTLMIYQKKKKIYLKVRILGTL